MNDQKYTRAAEAALAGLQFTLATFAQYAGAKAAPHVAPPAVCLADRLAAGARAPAQTPPLHQLQTIFSQLTLRGQRLPTAEEAPCWPVQPLALSAEVSFPQAPLQATALQPAYAALWEAFQRDVAALDQAHPEARASSVYLENLLLLAQRYAWCVPSAYAHLPDVSLYDHGRTTAALAACLTEQSDERLTALHAAPESGGEPVALLVGGDLSGVQRFIYTITARGATSALRGRSFYLQLLTEAAARYVLRELALPITNLLYHGGGNFYLLVRPGDAPRLREIQRQISRALLAHHRGELYLALEGVPLQARDFFAGRIAKRWDALHRQQQQAKQRRFAELGADLPQVFAPQGSGGDEAGECSVCGREHPDIHADAESGARKCRPCRDFETLGKALRNAEYLWLEEIPTPDLPDNPLAQPPGGWQAALGALGLKAGVIPRLQELPAAPSGAQIVLALNDAAAGDLARDLAPGPRTVIGRRLLVNVTPTLTRRDIAAVQEKLSESLYPDTVKPFSVLEVQAAGIPRLGVLRMDVDDLGQLFSKGFGAATTLSRVTALSFAIGLFFEGWVGELAAQINARASATRGDVLYSIYSGGDDLFFVGAWDAVIELARHIRIDLTRFTGGHPALHASGGIALVGGKYPLYQAAADAGTAEHAAKAHPGKDAVTFLGQTVPWAKFGLAEDGDEWLDTVYGLHRHLERLVTPEEEGGLGAPSALLRRLIRLQLAYETALEARRQEGEDVNRQGEAQGVWGPWMWQGYYTLKRMAGKERAATERAIAELADRLHADDFKGIHWIGLAARWVDLLTR